MLLKWVSCCSSKKTKISSWAFVQRRRESLRLSIVGHGEIHREYLMIDVLIGHAEVFPSIYLNCFNTELVVRVVKKVSSSCCDC
jgi:hypothetical protein